LPPRRNGELKHRQHSRRVLAFEQKPYHELADPDLFACVLHLWVSPVNLLAAVLQQPMQLSNCTVTPATIPLHPNIRAQPMTSAKKTAARSTTASSRLTRAQRTAILKALADPKRFELLERIARATCPLGCGAARAALAISPATLSHHVKELETAGLIEVRREGKFAFLSIRPEVLAAFADSLARLSQFDCTQA
jgi:ArsR family transcriptional regulator